MSITIDWEGPFSYEKVIREFKLDDNERCDLGLYQIYGPHPVYSNKLRPKESKVLLYIGKTTHSNVTFAGRIKSHGFCHSDDYDIYLGRIEGKKYNNDKDSKLWETDVDSAEKLLISNYAPAYNGIHVGDLRRNQLHGDVHRVINQGSRADLGEELAAADILCE